MEKSYISFHISFICTILYQYLLIQISVDWHVLKLNSLFETRSADVLHVTCTVYLNNEFVSFQKERYLSYTDPLLI